MFVLSVVFECSYFPDQEFQRFTSRRSQRGAPEMVIVQESDDEVQVINSPVV